MTKLSSSLPKDNRNGLSTLAASLVRRPHSQHVVIAVVDCSKITTDYDKGDVIPTAQIRRIEVLTPEDVPRAEQLMRRAMEQRTGGQMLDLDLEDELVAIFKTVDPETGELLVDPPVTITRVENRDDVNDDDADDGGDES